MAIIQGYGLMNSERLLWLTAALALGSGLTMLPWPVVCADWVPMQQVPAAAALNGLSFNGARTGGPVAGGIIYSAWGAASVFTVSGLSFLSLMLVYASWTFSMRAARSANPRPQQTIWESDRAILSHRAFRAVTLHSFFVFLAGSGFWALLPSLAYQARPEPSATILSVYMGTAGLGAMTATWLLPTLKRKLSVTAILSTYAVQWVLSNWASPLFPPYT